MKIKEPWTVDLDLVCYRCHRTPSNLPEYQYAAAAEGDGVTPEEYVWYGEGTLDRTTGRFCCTECYIAIGMPASQKGWTAP